MNLDCPSARSYTTPGRRDLAVGPEATQVPADA
jgi:hypothetical protein